MMTSRGLLTARSVCAGGHRLGYLSGLNSWLHPQGAAGTCRSLATQPSRLRRGWMRLAGLIKAFMDGTKALYRDVKFMSELQRRGGSLVLSRHAPREIAPGKMDFPFTRDEVQFIYQTKRDLMKMLPVIVVFFIPVLGYFVPVVVFMFPHKLLSKHFWTAEQRQDFRERMASERRELFGSMASLVQRSGTDDQRQNLVSVSSQLRAGDGQLDWTEFRKAFNLKRLPRRHLEVLIDSWGQTSKLPFPLAYQRRRLERHLQYLFLVDWLIGGSGGVGTMALEDVAQACEERGLQVYNAEEMREALESWVQLSTSFKECPVEILAHYPVLGLMDTEQSV